MCGFGTRRFEQDVNSYGKSALGDVFVSVRRTGWATNLNVFGKLATIDCEVLSVGKDIHGLDGVIVAREDGGREQERELLQLLCERHIASCGCS